MKFKFQNLEFRFRKSIRFRSWLSKPLSVNAALVPYSEAILRRGAKPNFHPHQLLSFSTKV